MFDEQILSHVTDGGVLVTRMTPNGQHQLVLGVGQAVGRGRLAAPLVEAAQGRPKREQPLIVFVARHVAILVCRNPIYLPDGDHPHAFACQHRQPDP